ncbi:glutaredoxin domain-containing protein, partial [Burkholderia multivorans]
AMITVYSKPGCVQCITTGRALTAKGLVEGADWEFVDLTLDENAAALEWVMGDLGYKQAPIVVVDDETHWAGFRPDCIAKLTH